jgi:hypothetical protein
VWKEDIPKQEGACVALFDTRHTGAPGCFQIEAAGDVGLLEKLGTGVGFSRGSIRQVNMQIEAERESARRRGHAHQKLVYFWNIPGHL